MLRRLTRRPRVAYVAGAAAVGLSAGAVYTFSKYTRTPRTSNSTTASPHIDLPSTSSSSPTDSSSSSSSEPNTTTNDNDTTTPPEPTAEPASARPQIEPPLVYASRVLTNRPDTLTQSESSMIIDDKSVGFSRSDSLVLSEQVEGYNSWSWSGPRALSLFMLFQGHNGLSTSIFLRNNFLDIMLDSLVGLFTRYDPITPAHTSVDETHSIPSGLPPQDEICDTITGAFRKMDEEIVSYSLDAFNRSPSKRAVFESLSHAKSGSSALVSVFESQTRMLRVAHIGKSRAVLGRRTGMRYKGQMMYESIPLSSLHTPSNPTELQLISESHPGENVAQLLSGHPVTRSFGDAAFKWSADVQRQLAREYLGEDPHPALHTPPYLSPDPEIYNIQIQPGDFLVLGSDGLWDSLTQDEVVGLVGWFVNNLDAKRWTPPKSRSVYSPWNKYGYDSASEYAEIKRSDQLPVHTKQVSVGADPDSHERDEHGHDGQSLNNGQQVQDKTIYYKRWNTEKKFINVDANAATHLTRNALGGADRDIRAAVLDMVSGTRDAARFKPELGVTVVFFNDIDEEDENN